MWKHRFRTQSACLRISGMPGLETPRKISLRLPYLMVEENDDYIDDRRTDRQVLFNFKQKEDIFKN